MTASTFPTTDGEISHRRRLLVLTICCASVTVAMMNISIVNIALPTIRQGLHTTTSGLQWTIDAYTLVLASFPVLAGSAADRFGRRRIFQVGLVAFAIGSLICGVAPDIGWLIAARVLQAIGGTMLTPVALAIVTTTFSEPAQRAKAIGVIGSITGLALAIGPILGGILVDSLGWRAIFWINVPILAVVIVATVMAVPESRATRTRRFDPVGQILVILLLSSLVYAIIESTSLGWASPIILGLLAVAVLSLIGIITYERRRADPLLDLRLFRSVPFSAANLMALFALCGFQGFLFVTTVYLQDVRGMTALVAGLCLLPVGGMIAVLSPVAGKLVGSSGPRLPLAISGAALAIGGIASLWLGPDSPLIAVLIVYALFGIFLGLVNPPITNTAVAGMPRSMAGVAASLVSTGRQAGTTLGVAIAGTIVGSSLGRGGTAYTDAEQGVWWMCTGLGIAILVLALVSTGRWARGTAERAATVFDELDKNEAPSRPAKATR
jgi:EmrB/QacA subfamily drug resistance transporter